jgi:hypothetical protein
MRRKLSTLLLLTAALASLALISGCGEEEKEGEAIEGEALELGELTYTVQITRFLNPDSREDRTYLLGQEPPPEGTDYLGVFMRIENESDEEMQIPSEFPVVDTRENSFEAIESESPFALELGAEIPAHGRIPAFDTAAASGPVKGSMLLYLLDEAATENRPLELEISGPDGETAHVELDL